MRYFLLHKSKHIEPEKSKRMDFPFVLDNIQSYRYFDNFTLYTWGGENGDVHVSKYSDSVLILSGYISATDSLGAFANSNEAVEKLNRYLAEGESSDKIEKIASESYGSFSLIHLSGRTKAIYCCTDRISSRPLWLQEKTNELIISSNAIAIARFSNERNYSPGSLVSYLLYATQVAPTQSLFSRIYGQKEGTILNFDGYSNNSKSIKKWYEYKHTPDNSVSVSGWVDLALESFSEAARRLLKTTSKPLLYLSGGVDSRLAASALIAVGARPLFCTLGDSLNIEIKVAKAVARSLHCQHEIILRDDEWYLRKIARAIFDTGGNFSWNHSHFSTSYQRLQASHGVDAAILGDFCEAFSKLFCSLQHTNNQAMSSKDFMAAFDRLPLQNYRPLNRERTLRLLKRDFREKAENELKDSIGNRYAEAREVSADPYIIGDYFFRWQNASCLPTFQMFNDVRSAGPERNLMFDKQLQRLLEVMPSTIRSKTNLGSLIVKKLHNRSSYIPNSNSLLPLFFPLSAHVFSKTMRPKVGKIRRMLFSNTHRTTASWPHLPLLYAGHPKWKMKIEERIFDKALLPNHIFDSVAIETCWKNFCEGDISLHSDVERLLGLSELNRLL